METLRSPRVPGRTFRLLWTAQTGASITEEYVFHVDGSMSYAPVWLHPRLHRREFGFELRDTPRVRGTAVQAAFDGKRVEESGAQHERNHPGDGDAAFALHKAAKQKQQAAGGQHRQREHAGRHGDVHQAAEARVATGCGTQVDQGRPEAEADSGQEDEPLPQRARIGRVVAGVAGFAVAQQGAARDDGDGNGCGPQEGHAPQLVI